MPLAPPGARPVPQGEPSSGSLRLTKRVMCSPLAQLYLTKAAMSAMSSRSALTLTAVVRGFLKFLSKTKTSGRNGEPICDWGIRFG